nr:hypothetical protein Q903MT_gene5377 [Picea sitchensis]
MNNFSAFLSSIIHSIGVIPRRQDTCSSLGLLEGFLMPCSALTFIYHEEEDRTEP